MNCRLEELTRVIARAFSTLNETMLSREDLAQAAGKGGFGKIENSEMQSALEALDAKNKVFLSGDLVFLV